LNLVKNSRDFPNPDSDRKTLKHITVALAGNPNSGKTTLFNALTGSHQHVGNYPGVTVEKKTGQRIYRNYRITFVDLPGAYSLSTYSLEERIARDFLILEKPDVVIDVIDTSNLERNLYLTTQIIELGVTLVLAMNMSDEVEKQGSEINFKLLSELIDTPAINTVASRDKGIDELLDATIHAFENPPSKNVKINYGIEMEEAISLLEKDLVEIEILASRFPLRWSAIKLLEQDSEIIKLIGEDHPLINKSNELRAKIEKRFGDDPELISADRRYGFIAGICRETVRTAHITRKDLTEKIDIVLANRILGIPVFLFLMWLTFQLTFKIGAYPVSWMESGIHHLGTFLSNTLPSSWFSSLLVDGVIGGVGGVIVFLPNILLLFLAIAILEDSGYMARAAFLMDRVMHAIGLHGKSFMPMLIGFGCSVPAFMATRTLENPRDRLLTMLMIPLMSCGAKLPVYVLLASAFFPNQAGNIIFLIYLTGIFLAILVALVLKKTYFHGPGSPFVMELPPYRVPTLKSILFHMWRRAWMYVRKAGTTIFIASVIIWIAVTTQSPWAPQQTTQNTVVENSGALKIENSIAGEIGKAIEPAIKPLGFDWKIGIALVTGFAAKEVVVSTLGTVYSIEDAKERSSELKTALKNDPVFNPLVAFCLMIFVLIYMPCIASISVFYREAGSLKWTIFTIAYTTSLAWIVTFTINQVGSLII
jgi:ferrous iron transport protein B